MFRIPSRKPSKCSVQEKEPTTSTRTLKKYSSALVGVRGTPPGQPTRRQSVPTLPTTHMHPHPEPAPIIGGRILEHIPEMYYLTPAAAPPPQPPKPQPQYPTPRFAQSQSDAQLEWMTPLPLPPPRPREVVYDPRIIQRVREGRGCRSPVDRPTWTDPDKPLARCLYLTLKALSTLRLRLANSVYPPSTGV
ncbi:hypothetical protein FB45DRAFT_1015533 [Roridomyces roridus]|uniref:Uncharacterized protein n=1 Tax=Roridomyces roridus TaxID=1738132 RepID=A0AAD7AWS6_9AGAR|nr:hypothetical protein FB45DRAFT_1015533 [Roridomyces roridus]